jgi:acyl-CoA synthetase (AMP-forming)/AMP-acid ligase II
MTIIDLLVDNANKYPLKTALVELIPEDNSRVEVNWQDFNNNANRIANTLIHKGIKKGDMVAMLMRNSLVWLEIYFGIIKTGAWVVPLNFRFNADDIKHCMNISESKIMFLDEEYIPLINQLRNSFPLIKEYIVIGEKTPAGFSNISEILSSTDTNEPNIKITELDDCGLYFTSGTTGAPKPILLPHSNMIFSAIVEQKHHYQTPEDNFILIPPLYHAGAKMHWFGSLITAGRATLLKKVTPKYILDSVQAEKGTIVWLLVPWAHDILAAIDSGEINLKDYDLSSWRLMHIGAQPVPPSLVKRWQKYFPNMQYDNNYGLSESTGPGCVHLGIENKLKVNCLGKAGHGWETRVILDDGKDADVEEIGELLVKGGGVMKEYFKNPEKTAVTIVDGWLHTGDMVKKDKDGFLYIVDRKKDLVISGGENIYPIEIEEVLHTHPDVHDVAVIGMPDERLGEVPAAVIQLKSGVSGDQKSLLKFCEVNLPRYKRPRFIFFDSVPRNPTGKIEKTKLRDKYSKQ